MIRQPRSFESDPARANRCALRSSRDAGPRFKSALHTMSSISRRPTFRFTRRVIASALALVCVLGLVAPHAHGAAEALFGLSAAQQSWTANGPSVSTLTDRDSARNHEHPCLACALQQRQGLSPLPGTVVEPLARISALVSAPTIAKPSEQSPHVSLRGPPAAIAFC